MKTLQTDWSAATHLFGVRQSATGLAIGSLAAEPDAEPADPGSDRRVNLSTSTRFEPADPRSVGQPRCTTIRPTTGFPGPLRGMPLQATPNSVTNSFDTVPSRRCPRWLARIPFAAKTKGSLAFFFRKLSSFASFVSDSAFANSTLIFRCPTRSERLALSVAVECCAVLLGPAEVGRH